MSLEDSFSGTRIGHSSTYRCQVGRHEYDTTGVCPRCGTREHPVRVQISRTTMIRNLEELSHFYRLEPNEFVPRLLRDLHAGGTLSKGRLIIHADLTPEQIEEVLAGWIFAD